MSQPWRANVAPINQAALVEHAAIRLVWAASLFGLFGAVAPMLGLMFGARPSDAGAAALPLSVAWVAFWLACALRPDTVARLLRGRWSRSLLTATVAFATAGSIAATGGLSSPIQLCAAWLCWSATVVLPAHAALTVGAALTAGHVAGFLLAGDTALAVARSVNHSSVLDPLLVVVIGLAIGGSFQRLIVRIPGVIWAIEHGRMAASSPSLQRLIAEQATAPAAGAAQPLTAASAVPVGRDAAVHQRQPDAPRATMLAAHDDARAANTLSALERATVDLLAAGYVVKQIARVQARSVSAVYASIASAKRKAGARSVAHLVALAWQPPSGAS